MDSRSHEQHSDKTLESVHVCQGCGNKTKLEAIDLKSIASGIVVCQICDRSGPINVQIVEADNAP